MFETENNLTYKKISSDRWMRKRYEIVTFLFALFTTFEVFKTERNGITILYADFFYFIFVAFTILEFIFQKKIFILQIRLIPIACVFFLLVISTLNFLPSIIDIGFDNIRMDGSIAAIKYSIRNFFQLLLYAIICFLGERLQKQAIKGFCYGFLLATILHSIYSIVQMVFMYAFMEDIHTLILGTIGITKETINHDLVNYIGYPIIRNSGFHWDPAYFGLWGCIGLSTFLYSQTNDIWKKFVIWIIALAWSFSFSRSGYFAFLSGVIIIGIGHTFNNSINTIGIKKILKYGLYICMFVFIVFLLLPIELQNYIVESFSYRFTYNPESKGTTRHLLYPLWAFEGSIHDIWHFIFGYGPRNSSRGIAYGGNILDLTTDRVYDIESDFCKMLLSYGVVCMILYLIFNYYIVKYYIKYINFKDSPIVSYFYIFGIIGSFFAGIFYMYNDSKWVWYMYLFALLFLNNNIKQDNGKCFNNNSKL